jgi:phosphoserine phosphatase
MLPPSWQLPSPLDAIIFDCDGTLSSIEGIDELAAQSSATQTVQELTAVAMGKTGLTPAIYQQRLDLVAPTAQQMGLLSKQYCINLTADSANVIQLFRRLNKSIYIVSAGLLPAIVTFGKTLGIPKENIFAVDIQFDRNGNFIKYDNSSPLTRSDGKRVIINELLKKHPRIGYIGDGLNDYAVYDLVTRFIGYGGIYYRKNIEALCEYYIRTASMTPILPLLLTADEVSQLTEAEEKLYRQGKEYFCDIA